MLLFVVLAIVILVATLFLHYSNHFYLLIWETSRPKVHHRPTHSSRYSDANIAHSQQCSGINSPSPNPLADKLRMRSSSLGNDLKPVLNLALKPPKKRFVCKLKGVDGQDFNFFPLSYVLYLIVMVLLCILIAITESLQPHTSKDHIYTFSIQSYHSNSIDTIHKLNINQLHDTQLAVYILDHVLVYGLLIVSIWESLFLFYRYYTTLLTTRCLHVISTKSVLLRFLYYPILFALAFLLQIHVWYFMCPLVILLHMMFNCYWTLRFSRLLTERYAFFSDMNTGNVIAENDQDMLKSVAIMKYSSVICSLLQTASLGLFVITYNVETIYVLPIVWSISSFIFSLNFIRNRSSLYRQYTRLCTNSAPADEYDYDCETLHARNKHSIQLHVPATVEAMHTRTVTPLPSTPFPEPKANTKTNYLKPTAIKTKAIPPTSKLCISRSSPGPLRSFLSKRLSTALTSHLSSPVMHMAVTSHSNESDETPISPHHTQNKFVEIEQLLNAGSTPSNSESNAEFEMTDDSDSELDSELSQSDDPEQSFGVQLQVTAETPDELVKAMKSHNVLVSYGFCSKFDEETVNQMTQCYKLYKAHRVSHGHIHHTIHGDGRNIMEPVAKLSQKKMTYKANTCKAAIKI